MDTLVTGQADRLQEETMRGVFLSVLLLFCLVCKQPEPFEIVTGRLPTGIVGSPYSAVIETRGGHGYVMLRVLDGQLPPGISFRQDGRDGALSGIPLLADTFLFTVEARDSAGEDSSLPSTIVTAGFAVVVQDEPAAVR